MKRQRSKRGASILEWLLLLALICTCFLGGYILLFTSEEAISARDQLTDSLDASSVDLRGDGQYVATFSSGKLCVGRYTGEGANAKPTGEPRCVSP